MSMKRPTKRSEYENKHAHIEHHLDNIIKKYNIIPNKATYKKLSSSAIKHDNRSVRSQRALFPAPASDLRSPDSR